MADVSYGSKSENENGRVRAEKSPQDFDEWVDGEEFFRSMNEGGVTVDFWNGDDKMDSSFVAESFGDGEGDWINGEDFFNKTEEEDTLRLDSVYDNTDYYSESIAELYTYSEVPEFNINMISFEDVLSELKISNPWQLLAITEKQSVILHLIDLLDVADYNCRTKAKCTLLYIAQGCWKEVRCLKDQQEWAIYNISLLMKNGVFDAILELLYFEVEKNKELVELRKLEVKRETMADSFDFRLTINLLYTMMETVRCNESLHSYLPYIKTEISEKTGNKKLLATLLFDMLGDFAGNKEYSHFPIKKIVLLLWKVILISLGGEKELQQFRKQRRESAGLTSEETFVEDADCEKGGKLNNNCVFSAYSQRETVTYFGMNDNSFEGYQSGIFRELPRKAKDKSKKNVSKVTKKEMDQFFDRVADKYLGVDHHLLYDKNMEFCFPVCIRKVLEIVQKNVYFPLSDVQLRFEEKKTNLPHTFSEEYDCIHTTETLYASLLPNLTMYTQGIIKVLSLVAPSTSWKNISEAVPIQRVEWSSTDSVIRNLDATRYKEIVFKALSAITLLLLKHTKVNHFLQFEHLSQELVKSEAISGFFSFFKIESLVYILRQNYSIERYNFPNCVFGDLPEVTIDEIRTRSSTSNCQRSAVLGYINAARILNKLTKGKPHRGIYMAKHTYYHNLTEALKIKEPTFQHYVIKLLKLQIKYVKIRSKNDKERKRFMTCKLLLLTDAYGKVRTNLTNEKWFCFAEEDFDRFSHLRCSFLDPTTQILIRRYHWRKYEFNPDQDLFPDYSDYPDCVSDSNSSVSTTYDCDCGEEELFRNNYERWLEEEIFTNPINWDEFLKEDFSYMN